MIDSHCHLDHEHLFSDLNEIIKRSKINGIKKMLTISTTFESFKKILNIINLDEMIYGTFGIHPHECEKNLTNEKDIIINIKKDKKLIGIGETGLDFFYNHSDKNKQISSFKSHIDAALTLNMPLIIHSRNAEEETIEILNAYKNQNLKILMHCFTGSLKFAQELITLNSFFSASGIITFKNSIELQNTFKIIPSNKILIETDSPYLAPIPMRGKKNEPSYIKYTLEKIAVLKNLNLKDMDKLTTNNFNSLFSMHAN